MEEILKKGAVKRVFSWTIILFIILVLCFSVYTVLAQTASHKDVVLVEMNPSQLDYEAYTILDMDKDSQITEEDFYLKLEQINAQVAGADSSLQYIQKNYGMNFRLTQITKNLAVKNSASLTEYQSILPGTRAELEHLAEEINAIQNAIGDLDLTDPNIIPIKQQFDAIDENIYYALWYTGRG